MNSGYFEPDFGFWTEFAGAYLGAAGLLAYCYFLVAGLADLIFWIWKYKRPLFP